MMLRRESRGLGLCLPPLPPSLSCTSLTSTSSPGERRKAVIVMEGHDLVARQRVARLQRDLHRARSDEALRTLRDRNREQASSIRAGASLRRRQPYTSDLLASGVVGLTALPRLPPRDFAPLDCLGKQLTDLLDLMPHRSDLLVLGRHLLHTVWRTRTGRKRLGRPLLGFLTRCCTAPLRSRLLPPRRHLVLRPSGGGPRASRPRRGWHDQRWEKAGQHDHQRSQHDSQPWWWAQRGPRVDVGVVGICAGAMA